MEKEKTNRSNSQVLPIEIIFGGTYVAALVVFLFVILMYLSTHSVAAWL